MSSNWQYHMIKTIGRLVAALPYSVVQAIGHGLGQLYYHLAGRQRRRSLEQMAMCLGFSEQSCKPIVKQMCSKLAQSFLEIMYIPSLNQANIDQYVTFENLHYLETAVAEGRGVVFLTAHLGNWEWLGASLALKGIPVGSIVKRQPNEQYTRLLNEYRQLAGIEVYASRSNELVSAAKALKKGRVIGFLSDQDAGYSGIMLDFFDRPASTPTGAAVFAKRFKSPIIPGFIVRKPEGGHIVKIYPPLYYEDTGRETQDIEAFMKNANEMIASWIREYPDEWLWFQKRWNTTVAEFEQHHKQQATVPLSVERMDQQT